MGKINYSEYRRAVRENCRILGVPVPKLDFVSPSQLPTLTTRSALSEDGSAIGINQALAAGHPVPGIWFDMAHECRHIWQIKNGMYTAAYQDSAALSMVDYNAQPEEIDANAYAQAVLDHLFGLRRTFEDAFPPDIVSAMKSRQREIEEVYFV